ncbi:hypothetical protein BAUCODRAFT_31627 [Baudoinia panamericana UAMH 10762]|uniref:DNA helicase n=1 Tax=Baudoinia panamericana (strain UAMH 10762) TaxID=717646 RepID=M2NIT5_BAUPA|nr:uncharacterized protein BAUCODRAFT_31627 [Baudoinia panamericana UAMH 10762]EMC99309.1 hypothetical protein BAUCODRAFT_31627 [Baudoinia panamericana UAMH 10762]
MSATHAPESGQTTPLQHSIQDAQQHASASQSLLDSTSAVDACLGDDDKAAIDDSYIKIEEGISEHQQDDDDTTTTSLRPDPQPSTKRRESAAADITPSSDLHAKNKKRKRGASPPWQFGTVEKSAVKTADGRRISARVNVGTPLVSEAESQGRSGSQSATRSRPPSPPWKKFEAEGPTSVNVDGVRKSGRVNKELTQQPKPIRTSPRQKKQVDKAAEHERVAAVPRPVSRGKASRPDKEGATVVVRDDVRRSQSPASKIAELKAKIAALQPSRSFDSSPEEETKPASGIHKRKRSDDAIRDRKSSSPRITRRALQPGRPSASPMVTRPSPRLKLKFSGAKKVIAPPHPQSTPRAPARPPLLSLSQVIEPHELRELQQPYMENERGPPGVQFFRTKNERLAFEEGEMRKKLVEAAKPGGALSVEACSIYEIDDGQEEPPQPNTHADALAKHAVFFRNDYQKWRADCTKRLKKIAYEAQELWKKWQGPTEEDIRAEQDRIFRLIHKQVVSDMRAKWDMVGSYVQQLRKERWEAEEDARRQERLQRQLEQAQAMVSKQRGDEDDDSDVKMEDDTASDVDDGESEGDAEEEGDYNLSESASDDDEDEGEMTGDALEAYLAANPRADPPDKDPVDEEQDTDPDATASHHPTDLPLPLLLPNDSTADRTLEKFANLDSAFAGSPDEEHVDGLAALLQPQDEDEDEHDQEDQDQYLPDVEFVEEAEQNALNVAATDRTSKLRSSPAAADIAPNRADPDDADIDLSDDESVDMEDSDEDMSSTGDEDEAAGSDDDRSSVDAQVEEAGLSTVGLLFGRKQLTTVLGLPTPTTSAEGDAARDRTAEPVSADEHGDAADLQAKAWIADAECVEDPAPTVEIDASMQDADALNDGHDDEQPAAEPMDGVTTVTAPRSPSPEAALALKQLVPVPTLIRGTLRSYQHTGLDWLASLHRNGINGILADEMGLGKTIQTIALLGHLAEHCGIWEPHLIIVPTSVILNWVAEFQKFLPGFRVLAYYGTAEERAFKRQGWVNDPHLEDRNKRGYNVIITSYQIAMADRNAIRNVQWHYLVLDEAHTIRNFNSQRWQTLIRLKTKARLLLTGTPLQNSLTELWSLLTFLTAGDDDPAHGDLEEFLSHWKEPVKEIFDRGVQTLSQQAQKVVDQLHVSLRPFLLRRLKSEVEKQLPKKTEKVIVCKLSKRQRQLYQEYMGLASTRESLMKGNAISAGKVLMSLRKVCNHPDQFDPRPIQTSYAMEVAAAEPFAVKERAIRKLLGDETQIPHFLMLAALEGKRKGMLKRSRELDATKVLRHQVREMEAQQAPTAELSTPAGCLVLSRLRKRNRKLQHLRDSIQATQASISDSPVFGSDLRELVSLRRSSPYTARSRRVQPQSYVRSLRTWPALGHRPLALEHRSDWLLSQTTNLQQDIWSLDRMAENLHDTIFRFAFCTPVATAPVLDNVIPIRSQKLLRAIDAYPNGHDFAQEARVRTSIAFPDSRLLIYDSGKLQRLSMLLREQLAKGSRSLIFTQMSLTLNILESFLNLLGLPYLRLDGSTSPERRMLYSSEFNRPDSKYACMILSSRAGGVGLNLTGASTVIFYDLDWNPQMDRQCMDRAHRIGQVRDVEVFKMVSEKTVEENILRRANQKSLLDQTVIQEGHFTTEYQQPSAPQDIAHGEVGDEDEDDIQAAIERVFGNDKTAAQAIASVEDQEDVQAAEKAWKEENADADEFNERASSKGRSVAPTPGPSGTIMDGDELDEDAKGHLDGWMISTMEWILKDVPFVPPVVRKVDKHGRDPSHRPKRRR